MIYLFLFQVSRAYLGVFSFVYTLSTWSLPISFVLIKFFFSIKNEIYNTTLALLVMWLGCLGLGFGNTLGGVGGSSLTLLNLKWKIVQ